VNGSQQNASGSPRRREAEALKRSDAMKTAVLRAVSHDLRSPLMAILTAAGALSHGELSLDLEDRRELTETILGEAERLARIVRNLLDLSRVTSSRSCGRCARAFAVQATRSIRVHPPVRPPSIWSRASEGPCQL
jgi:two-component system sensor histidine kinase KdpD